MGDLPIYALLVSGYEITVLDSVQIVLICNKLSNYECSFHVCQRGWSLVSHHKVSVLVHHNAYASTHLDGISRSSGMTILGGTGGRA